MYVGKVVLVVCFVLFQAEDGIRDLVRSRGLGDVYKRQALAQDSTNWSGGDWRRRRNRCQYLNRPRRP